MEEDFVVMKVTGLTIDPFTNMPIVILKDDSESVALPIWIGLVEASSIATELEEVEITRPMTHDLMKAIFEKVDVKLKSVEIYDLTDKTFFANLYFDKGGQEFVIDARPSDALALALRCEAPIHVTRKVLDKSRKIEQSHQNEDQVQSQKWTEILENLTPDDFGKYKM